MISDKRQVSIGSTRIGMDVTAVVIGLLLGASFGPASSWCSTDRSCGISHCHCIARFFNKPASQGHI